MPLISFPQAFALNKGANYAFNATFAGLAVSTLTAPAGYKFDQPAFQTPAANLYNSASTTYTIAGLNAAHTESVLKNGGNLVDTAIKWTNGKSLGNWYQIQRHGATPTGGSVTSNGKVLRVTCGNTTNLLNRSLMHDVLTNKSGNVVTENSASVSGYVYKEEPINWTLYFKGYVEPFDFKADAGLGLGTTIGSHTIFFVGHRYFHTQIAYQNLSGIPLDTHFGDAKGWGFQAIKNGNNFTWYAVFIIEAGAATGSSEAVYALNTGVSAFVSTKLEVNYTNTTWNGNGVITWKVNGTQVAQQNISLGNANGNVMSASEPGNSLYSAIASLKGGAGSTIPGQFTLCVEEAGTWRNYLGPGKLGLTATLVANQSTVTLTGGGTTAGLVPGMRLYKNSGTGNFNTALAPLGVFVGSITNSTTFTVVNQVGTLVGHAAGAINFDVGRGLFPFNNFEDTDTEVTASEIDYHNTGLRLLKKLK